MILIEMFSSIKKLLFSLYWLMSWTIYAQTPKYVPLPSSLYSINDLVSEFRSPLKTKIEDLKKNYRFRSSNNFVEYSSNEDINCLFRVWEKNSILTKIEYFHRREGNEAIDVLRYSGCGDQLSLIERVVRVGKNQKPLTFQEFSNANLDFELNKSLDRYYYQLQNNFGQTLFSLNGRWLNEEKTHSLFVFKIREQEFLVINYHFLPEQSRVTYTFKGYSVSYQNLPYFNLNVTQNHDGFSFKVIVKKSQPNTPFYLSSRDTLLGQNPFLNYFSIWAIKNGLENVKKFVDFHLFWFPPTDLLSAGGQSRRLINELRLNLNRVLNNNNINLVELYLRNLIQSVEKGLIIDRRPRE